MTALSAALVACGGGGSNDGLDGEQTLREQAAAVQKAVNGSVSLQTGSSTANVTGPVLKNFSVSKTDVSWPDSVTFTVEAQAPGSGVCQVELYEVGKSMPVAVMSGSPYHATLPLGAKDNGVHAYYVRAYDCAYNRDGTHNATSNMDAQLRVNVAISSNGMEPVGSLQADFGLPKSTVWNFRADPHHDGAYVALGSTSSVREILKFDYARHSLVKIKDAEGSAMDLAFDPKRPDVLYLNRSRDLLVSADAGATWKTVAVKDFLWLGTGHMSHEGTHIAFAPGGGKLFAFSSGGGYDDILGWGETLTFSTDGGVSWTKSSYPSSYPGLVGPVVAAASNENIVYAGIRNGVMRSGDGGRTFVRTGSMPPHIAPPIASVVTVSVDPFSAKTVLALLQVGGKGLQSMLLRSTNGGASWSPVQLPDTPLGRYLFGGQRKTVLMAMVHNPSVKGLVYVPVAADENSAAVLRSKDGGASWELLTYFGPALKGGLSWYSAANWMLSTKPVATGAVQLFVSTPDGFNRYLDHTALK